MKKLTIHVQTIMKRKGLEDKLIPKGQAYYLSCKTFVHISANGYTYRINHDKFNYLIKGKTWEIMKTLGEYIKQLQDKYTIDQISGDQLLSKLHGFLIKQRSLRGSSNQNIGDVEMTNLIKKYL